MDRPTKIYLGMAPREQDAVLVEMFLRTMLTSTQLQGASSSRVEGQAKTAQ